MPLNYASGESWPSYIPRWSQMSYCNSDKLAKISHVFTTVDEMAKMNKFTELRYQN